MSAARWLSALGLLGLACVVGGVVRALLLGEADPRVLGLLGGGGALLLAYAFLDRDPGPSTSDAGRAPSAGGAVASTVLAALVAVGLYVGVRAVDTTVDLTSRGGFTPTPHTLAVLDALTTPVEVRAYFRAGGPPQRDFERVVTPYLARSPQLTLTWIDPVSEPRRAEADGVTMNAGEVVLVAGERRERLPGTADERVLTDGLVRVTSTRTRTVCWADGQGEADADDTRDATALGTAVVALEGGDVQVVRAPLLAGAPDASCQVLVIARPTLDVPPGVARELVAWVAAGGRLLLLVEPTTAPVLTGALRSLGVVVEAGVVVDPTPDRALPGTDDPAVLLIPPRALEEHPVTAGLRGALVLPVARPVRPVDDAPGVATRVLFRSGDLSWAETSLDPGSPTVAGPGEPVGPVPLAVAVEVTDAQAVPLPDVQLDPLISPRALPVPADGGRVVVIGDAGFAGNRAVGFGSNRELFLDAVAWLLGEDVPVGERPDDLGEVLDVRASDLVVLAAVALVGAPGAALAAAGVVLWRRRRR